MGRTRTVCEACREKHNKCDGGTPECQRCRQLGLRCVQPNPIQFMLPEDFSRERRRKNFSLDGESSTNLATTISSLDDWNSAGGSSTHHGPTFDSLPIETSPIDNNAGDHYDTRESERYGSASHQTTTRSQSHPIYDQPEEILSPSTITSSSFDLAWIPWNSPAPPTWLRDEKEVRILKHYVDVLSTWLDFCDIQRTFGIAVPQLAAVHKPLLNAILAVSSKHLSILTGQDLASAGTYYQACLEALIPLLNDESAVMNDIILAVIVILRLSEEIESPLAHTAWPVHTQGIRECVRAQGPIAHQNRLRYTAFCVMVRQENYLALMNLCPIGWDLDAFVIPGQPDPSDELNWTMLIIRLCADLVQFSHDERSKQDLERWQHLKNLNEQWSLTRPKSFGPVFAKMANRDLGEPFPKSWFLQVWHSTSIQHYHLNCVLLAATDPRVPRFGPGRQEAHRKAEDEILSHMRHICGIALVNTDQQPCMVTAYMSISICGDRFTDRLDQERMFELLVTLDKNCAWPTLGLQEQLKKSWGWNE